MKSKALLSLFILMLFVPVLILSGCPAPAATGGVEFELEDLTGKTVNLSDYRGKVVVLDFWATWCPPCRQATPYMVKLNDKYQGKDVQLIGINLDYDKTSKEIQIFSDQEKINYLILKGDQKVSSAFRIRGIPKFIVIDQDGNIAKEYTGFSPQLFQSQIPAEIDKLLEK